MAEIIIKLKTEYDKGDVVIFLKNNEFKTGIIESYYADTSCNDTIYYNIRTSKNKVYTYSCDRDIPEYNIYYKISEEDAIKFIKDKILSLD